MASSGMLRRVALVLTDVSEELSASFIRMTRIVELGTTLLATDARCEDHSNHCSAPSVHHQWKEEEVPKRRKR
jgi:hypothetical protein